MIALFDANCCSNPFAEFPCSQCWRSVREYVGRLDRAQEVSFVADDNKTYLLFEYAGVEFCLHDAETTILLSTNSEGCPESLQDELILRLSRFFRFWLNH